MLVATCPREVRHDPVACADHLQGVMAAHGITDLVDRGRRLAAPHLAAADEALDQLTAANLRLEAAADRRRNLPDEVVDAPPIRAGRAAIRRQLAQNQHVAAQRELAGDLEHRQTGSPGWTRLGGRGHRRGHRDRRHAADLQRRPHRPDLDGGPVAGAQRRAGALQPPGRRVPGREAAGRPRDQGRRDPPQHQRLSRLPRAPRNGAARRAETPVGPGGVAGLAPSAAQVRHTRRAQWLALAIYGVPLGLLLAGIYLRMLSSTGRLVDLGAFGYVFPLIAAAVLASLLWALIVEPYSRGNALGDHLRSQQAVDNRDGRARRGAAGPGPGRGGRGPHAGRGRPGRADVGATRKSPKRPSSAHRGLQIAHAALGIATIGHVRAENLIAQPFPHRDRIGRAIAAEELRTDLAAEALTGCAFPPIDTADSPHAVYATPPTVVPDLAFVNPGTLAPYAESTLALNPADDGVGDEPRRGIPHRGRRRCPRRPGPGRGGDVVLLPEAHRRCDRGDHRITHRRKRSHAGSGLRLHHQSRGRLPRPVGLRHHDHRATSRARPRGRRHRVGRSRRLAPVGEQPAAARHATRMGVRRPVRPGGRRLPGRVTTCTTTPSVGRPSSWRARLPVDVKVLRVDQTPPNSRFRYELLYPQNVELARCTTGWDGVGKATHYGSTRPPGEPLATTYHPRTHSAAGGRPRWDRLHEVIIKMRPSSRPASTAVRGG